MSQKRKEFRQKISFWPSPKTSGSKASESSEAAAESSTHRLFGRIFRGRSRSASPSQSSQNSPPRITAVPEDSNPDITKTDLKRSPTPSNIVVPELWNSAIESLPRDERKVFTQYIMTRQGSNEKKDLWNQLLEAANQKRQECENKRWKVRIGNQELVLRDVIEKIVNFASKFRDIGNILVQYDGGHLAVPWAGFSLVLQFAIAEKEVYGKILTDLETIARLITKCVYYEALYLSHEMREISTSCMQSLRDCLVEVYHWVIMYLLKAIQIYEQQGQ